MRHDILSRAGGLLALPAFQRVSKQIDPFGIGGARLLDVNGVVIISHAPFNRR